ncbi:MAG: hypothetical protein Q8861_10195 [Bacteroidota bacterium]|nr:hypothetical protein [Bacteroidota bacterium]
MEYKTILVIIGAIIIALLLKSCVSKNNNKNENRTSIKDLPKEKVENDKVVLIENVNLGEVKKAIEQFCNNYNQEDYRALPLLTIVSENKFVVTFPYDIDFVTYCFFVNYMYYPNDISYKPTIKAWATTKSTDLWIKGDIANKKVMLYIPADDKDFDNVYLTTSNNIGYKMGFAMGEESQRLDAPKQKYSEQVNFDNSKTTATIQFK